MNKWNKKFLEKSFFTRMTVPDSKVKISNNNTSILQKSLFARGIPGDR